VVSGCHVKPSRFYITPSFWAAGLRPWKHWNNSTASSGVGYIGSCGCDGIRLYLWRVRHHHFTRLTVITQGLRYHYHWSSNAHRWQQ
jgi:hypothetical protein